MITVLTPSGEQVNMPMAENELVLNDQEDFVVPEVGGTATLLPVTSNTGHQVSHLNKSASTDSYNQTQLIVKAPVIGTITFVGAPDYPYDPSAVIDPTGGACLCGITCLGANIKYVKVTPAAQ